MATTPKSAFDSLKSDSLGPDMDFDRPPQGDFDDAPMVVPGSMQDAIDNGIEDNPDLASGLEDEPFGDDGLDGADGPQSPKDLLDVRGFFVGWGEGVYDGATRESEGERDSFYVQVADYETGQIHKLWGVAFKDVMAEAESALKLQPGHRIHLRQQGKREMVVSDVDATRTMVFRKTFANAWTCLPDRGPLPSQLAHLTEGINVDAKLDRIALRYDMGLDDPRLPAWKAEQKRIINAIGDNPQTIENWLDKQTRLDSTQVQALVVKAVEIAGYTDADPERKRSEVASRMSALDEMSPGSRFDFLMASAKPHLMEVNAKREEGLRQEVVDAIEQLAVMSTPGASPDSNERKAIRSALAQSLDGLSMTQQADYLARRRTLAIEGLTAGLVNVDEEEISGRVHRDRVIDAVGMSAEEYKEALRERLEMADGQEERAQMMEQEIEARRQESGLAAAAFEPLELMWQRFAGERDIDATAYVAGRLVAMLGDVVSKRVLPGIATTFESLGGIGAWRRKGALTGLQDMQDALNAAKQSEVYRAFENDPSVLSAIGGRKLEDVLVDNPNLSRTEVVMEHLQAQERGSAPKAAKAAEHKGLWTGMVKAGRTMADRIGSMSPEHLIKRGGGIDSEWVKSMQAGLAEFSDNLKKTLIPEEIMKQMQEMIASIVASIKMMMELAKQLLSSKAKPSVGQDEAFSPGA